MSMVARHTATSPFRSDPNHVPRVVYHVVDPNDVRAGLFREGFAAAGVAAPVTVSAREAFRAPEDVVAEMEPHAVLRVDSPGRSADVNAEVFQAGASGAMAEGAPSTTFERDFWQDGGLLGPRQWYLGFATLLQRLERAAIARGLRLTQPAADVLLSFDKVACHRVMRERAIPVPASLGSPRNARELYERMETSGMSRVFVKSRHGSGASGIVALQASRGRARAWTTVERQGDRLFNTRRLVVLDDTVEISSLIDALCRHGVHVERWFPKATVAGRPTDLRILVVGGEPGHVVVRHGRGPMTNLHLGGVRSDERQFREHVPKPVWGAMLDDVRRAASIFQGSFQVSFDVAFDTAFRKYSFLEANAFGDLLKGITHEGMTTYELQARRIQDWCAR